MTALGDLWAALPAAAQDALLLAALLSPAPVLAALLLRGLSVGGLTGALLWRFRRTNLLFAALMALSVGLGAAVIAQERALRQGAARAADAFDVIVAAPGDRLRLMLAAVYLDPADAPLLRGEALARLQADSQIDLLAPLAFGDSHAGAPVVGSTAAFVAHLSGPLAEGRVFAAEDEAVAGARAPVAVGDSFTPAHGHGPLAETDAHDGVSLRVVGRMAPTGTPWDKAIVTPVEAVWNTHGLANGHAPGVDRIGPPFDPDYFPGTPAFVIHAQELWRAYAVQARHDRGDMMAFFPGAELARLNALVGDVRQAMSLMATLTQALVAAGMMAGLAALARLFGRRFALLRALGAPRRFVLAAMWSYAVALVGAGCLAGLGVGWLSARLLSALVEARTDLALAPALGWPELHLVAGFFSLTCLLALLPGLAAYRRDVPSDLRETA